MVIPENAVEQLGDLPVVVAVLLIAMAAVVGVVWIGSRLLTQRDAVFMKFFGDQRDLDRALGKQTSEGVARALGGLADAIRDNGTATLTLIQGISDKVDDALSANSAAIRESNYMLAKLGHDVDELIRRQMITADDDDEPPKGKKR